MENMAAQAPAWDASKKILFRFFAVFFIAHILPWSVFGSGFDAVVYWAGKALLHIPYKIEAKPNGSGDTTYNYVEEFIIIVVSFISCIIWSIADRKRPSYNKAYYWVMVAVRYYLAAVLLDYGFAKIFKTQFPAPSMARLTQPYGNSSPMGLAWTFLGYSTAYNYFMGFFECIGGLLILFRRTRLFGACIATTVVTNIVMINLCYDVPVKLFSTNLLLLCLFILAADAERFVNFFIFNRAVPAAAPVAIFTKKKWKITHIVLKVIIVGGGLFSMVYDGIDMGTYYAKNKSKLEGCYSVQTFVCNNDTLPSLTTDSVRWSKLVISNRGYAMVRKMNDSSTKYEFKEDAANHTFALTSDREFTVNMTYGQTDSNTYTMTGGYHGATLYAVLKRMDDKSFLLTSRGFHWINEYPFNR